jgi:hypothetical protein
MNSNWPTAISTLLCMILLTTMSFPMVTVAQTVGWIKAGDHPEDYNMGVESGAAFTGNSSGYVKNNKPDPKGFGTYMQMFSAEEYRGKRIRLSAYVKAENVENWAGVWMRVDTGVDRARKTTAFDNMQDRPIQGTQGWTQYFVVLDVDPEANAVAFGILLAGKGAVRIDDVTFDIVGSDVPTTGNAPGVATASPRNLDFEGGQEK